MIKKLKQILEYQRNTFELENHNEYTRSWSKGYFRALNNILLLIKKLKMWEDKHEDK